MTISARSFGGQKIGDSTYIHTDDTLSGAGTAADPLTNPNAGLVFRSVDDAVPGTLAAKLAAGNNMSFAEITEDGVKRLQINGPDSDVSDNQNIWYLDTTNGLDTNSGLSRSAPKKTGDAVVIACKTAGKTTGRLVVMTGSSGVVFNAATWANTTFPFYNVDVESYLSDFVWNGISASGAFELIGGTHVFNQISTLGLSIFKISQATFNGCSLRGANNLDVGGPLQISGLAVTGDSFVKSVILSISSSFIVLGGVKINVNKLNGNGSFYSGNGYANVDLQTNVFALEGFFSFVSQIANSSIKITAAKMARTATTKLLYLGAEAGVTVNYQLVVDTMGSIVPMEIANPAGTVVGKVVELLKYENKVDAEISRATAAEALKANKLTTVNNSTDTAYTFLASDANTCHIVNTSAATTRTVPSDSTAPDIAIGDSIEVQNLGTGVVTFVAASGVTIRSSLTLVMYGQYSVCMLRKIAANTWILTGERTAV